MVEKVNERSEMDGLTGRSIGRTGGSSIQDQEYFWPALAQTTPVLLIYLKEKFLRIIQEIVMFLRQI